MTEYGVAINNQIRPDCAIAVRAILTSVGGSPHPLNLTVPRNETNQRETFWDIVEKKYRKYYAFEG